MEINQETDFDMGGTETAYAMTKSKSCSALKDFIDTDTVKMDATKWAERLGD